MAGVTLSRPILCLVAGAVSYLVGVVGVDTFMINKGVEDAPLGREIAFAGSGILCLLGIATAIASLLWILLLRLILRYAKPRQ
jgi:hypothetical protein